MYTLPETIRSMGETIFLPGKTFRTVCKMSQVTVRMGIPLTQKSKTIVQLLHSIMQTGKRPGKPVLIQPRILHGCCQLQRINLVIPHSPAATLHSSGKLLQSMPAGILVKEQIAQSLFQLSSSSRQIMQRAMQTVQCLLQTVHTAIQPLHTARPELHSRAKEMHSIPQKGH